MDGVVNKQLYKDYLPLQQLLGLTIKRSNKICINWSHRPKEVIYIVIKQIIWYVQKFALLLSDFMNRKHYF